MTKIPHRTDCTSNNDTTNRSSASSSSHKRDLSRSRSVANKSDAESSSSDEEENKLSKTESEGSKKCCSHSLMLLFEQVPVTNNTKYTTQITVKLCGTNKTMAADTFTMIILMADNIIRTYKRLTWETIIRTSPIEQLIISNQYSNSPPPNYTQSFRMKTLSQRPYVFFNKPFKSYPTIPSFSSNPELSSLTPTDTETQVVTSSSSSSSSNSTSVLPTLPSKPSNPSPKLEIKDPNMSHSSPHIRNSNSEGIMKDVVIMAKSHSAGTPYPTTLSPSMPLTSSVSNPILPKHTLSPTASPRLLSIEELSSSQPNLPSLPVDENELTINEFILRDQLTGVSSNSTISSSTTSSKKSIPPSPTNTTKSSTLKGTSSPNVYSPAGTSTRVRTSLDGLVASPGTPRSQIRTSTLPRTSSNNNITGGIELSDAVKLILQGQNYVSILDQEVSLEKLAPDISLNQFHLTYIPFNSLNNLKELGSGGFASVFKSTLNKNIRLSDDHHNENVAVKKINIKPNKSGDELTRIYKEFRHEIMIQNLLQGHSNIVKLIGIVLEPMCIISELIEYGDLYNFIHNYDNTIPWKLKIKLAMDICEGIKWMHGKNIAHLDLKSPNVMMYNTSCPNKQRNLCAKIGDFGTCKFITKESFTKRLVDNPVWLAPEIIENKPYNQSVDIYAFGVICWELLSRDDFFGKVEWLSDIELWVTSGKRPVVNKQYPKSFRNIIERCWNQNSAKRPDTTWILTKLAKIMKNCTDEVNSTLTIVDQKTSEKCRSSRQV
eukprot:TRINITY_DN698_c1_g2_i3.p1 TRINITY_DN698_c1_g2~~TRINITY_DN698_c1_g2_i3.p1  ORF type:complete len:772 (-),score=190.32 TRINITY_DN698_c1_g2_i3:71-2386(-)